MIKKKTIFCFFIVGFLLISSCEIFEDEEDVWDLYRPLPFEDFEEAAFLIVNEPGTAVFRNQHEWEIFWDAHILPTFKEMPLPEVDFEHNILIAVFWGSGYSGCSNWSDSIQGIMREQWQIEVHIGSLANLGDCEMLVRSMQVVKLAREDLPVIFTGEVPGA